MYRFLRPLLFAGLLFGLAGVAAGQSVSYFLARPAHLRAGPSTYYDATALLPRETVVRVLSFERTWAQVRLEDGRTGWIEKTSLPNIATRAKPPKARADGTNSVIPLATLLVIALYFVPVMVAGARKHHQTAAIGVLTFLLGWTVFGWIVALVWAFTAVRKEA